MRDGLIQARGHAMRAAWAVADQGINPLVQLLITPFLLRSLGKGDFAIWVLANTAIAVSPFVSLGAGVAATKHVSADLGTDCRDGAIEATRAALTIVLFCGSAAALFAYVLAFPIVDQFFQQMGGRDRVASVVALCGVASAVQEIDNVYAGVLRGAGRFDLGAKVEIPARMLIGSILITMAGRQAGVERLYVALLAMMLGKALAKAYVVGRLLETPLCLLPTARPASIARILRFGIWQWLQSAGSAMFTVSDQLLIGGLLGAASLARYSVCLQIAQYVHAIPSVMMQVIFPHISALGAELDSERGNSILRRATLVSIAVACSIGVPLTLFAYPILKIWVGAEFARENYLLLIVLVFVHLALAASVGAYFVLLGTGRVVRSAAIGLAAGATQSIFAVIVAPLGLMPVACNRFLYALIIGFTYRIAKFGEPSRPPLEKPAV